MKVKHLLKTLRTLDPETDIYVSENGVAKENGLWKGNIAEQTAIADNHDGEDPFLIIAAY